MPKSMPMTAEFFIKVPLVCRSGAFSDRGIASLVGSWGHRMEAGFIDAIPAIDGLVHGIDPMFGIFKLFL